jgi:hypothetical protein
VIKRAGDVYGHHPGVDLAFSVEHFSVEQRRLSGDVAEPRQAPHKVVSRAKAETHGFVDQGRWVADCPFCTSAQVVDPDEPRFFCVDCANEPVGGLYVSIEFPEKVEEIERALLMRHNVLNRNWKVGESVSRLHAENREAARAIEEQPPVVIKKKGSE